MKEQWIREGFSSYYVVKKEQKLTYEKNILRYHALSCLLPCEFRMQDEEEYYYYETGIYTPIKDKINIMDPKLFFSYLLEVFEEVESYLLKLDHLNLDPQLIFLDKENRPVVCYLPEYEKNIYEQLRDFLEECIDMISGNDKKKVRFYYEFHSFLVKEKPNMEQMKEYLEIHPKVSKQEPVKIEETKDRELLPEVTYEENYINKKERLQRIIKKCVCIIICIISICGMIYFMIHIFKYGLYYLFLIGFLGACIGIGLSVYGFYKLWKNNTNKNENVDFYDEKKNLTTLVYDEKTTLLEDDDKTVLLMEEPIGTLVARNQELDEIAITDNGFIIGSSIEGTDYQLTGTGISRRHIRFYKKENNVYCEDLDSTNGVAVNGRKIKTICLQEGDRIRIGLEEFVFKGNQ